MVAAGHQRAEHRVRLAQPPVRDDALFERAELEEEVAQRIEQHPAGRAAGERRGAVEAQFLAERGEGEGLGHGRARPRAGSPSPFPLAFGERAPSLSRGEREQEGGIRCRSTGAG